MASKDYQTLSITLSPAPSICSLCNIYIYGTYTIHTYIHTYIKTHGSESRGQEEAGLRDEPVSYLQVAPL